MPEKDQLQAIRRMLLDRADEYRAAIDKKALKGKLAPFDGLKMTRGPKGFLEDHPAFDLILQRQWGVSAQLPADSALSSGLMKEIVTRFKLATPMVRLLNSSLSATGKRPLF